MAADADEYKVVVNDLLEGSMISGSNLEAEVKRRSDGQRMFTLTLNVPGDLLEQQGPEFREELETIARTEARRLIKTFALSSDA